MGELYLTVVRKWCTEIRSPKACNENIPQIGITRPLAGICLTVYPGAIASDGNQYILT